MSPQQYTDHHSYGPTTHPPLSGPTGDPTPDVPWLTALRIVSESPAFRELVKHLIQSAPTQPAPEKTPEEVYQAARNEMAPVVFLCPFFFTVTVAWLASYVGSFFIKGVEWTTDSGVLYVLLTVVGGLALGGSFGLLSTFIYYRPSPPPPVQICPKCGNQKTDWDVHR